ncbi:hypothetical protein MCOR14_012010 [Pyricularia oryzae]|nr:hypothetical protein MCOR14_012010 [Pyricularia oryzae]
MALGILGSTVDEKCTTYDTTEAYSRSKRQILLENRESMFGLRLLIKWLMFGGVIFPVVSFRKSCQTQRVLASYIRNCASQRRHQNQYQH